MPVEPTPRDALETPTVRPRPAAFLAAGLLGFLAAALAVLGVYFRLLVPAPGQAPPRPFPSPQLETSIDPRSLPPAPPGPAQPPREPPSSPLAEAILQRAMAQVAARGPQAYDPPPSAGERP